MELKDSIVELYRRVATQIPDDVLEGLVEAKELEEKGSPAYYAISTILDNIKLAKENSKPMCQDTGTPIFFVNMGEDYSQRQLRHVIVEATRVATKIVPLRPNAVHSLTGKNSGDNTGINTPVVYFEEWDKDKLHIDLMLKGGGSENVGKVYQLPNIKLKAGRDLEGVRKCIINAVYQAQGKGCPPQILGVAIGSPKDAVAQLSKRQLLRRLNDKNPDPRLAKFEKNLLEELNTMGIGPAGLGGKKAVLGVKVGAMHRHPASFFVDVSFACWACRRGSFDYSKDGGVIYG